MIVTSVTVISFISEDKFVYFIVQSLSDVLDVYQISQFF